MPFNAYYTGEPIGDYGLKAYKENTEIKNEMREKTRSLEDRLYALANMLGVKFVEDDDGNVYAIKTDKPTEKNKY